VNLNFTTATLFNTQVNLVKEFTIGFLLLGDYYCWWSSNML